MIKCGVLCERKLSQTGLSFRRCTLTSEILPIKVSIEYNLGRKDANKYTYAVENKIIWVSIDSSEKFKELSNAGIA